MLCEVPVYVEAAAEALWATLGLLDEDDRGGVEGGTNEGKGVCEAVGVLVAGFAAIRLTELEPLPLPALPPPPELPPLLTGTGVSWAA